MTSLAQLAANDISPNYISLVISIQGRKGANGRSYIIYVGSMTCMHICLYIYTLASSTLSGLVWISGCRVVLKHATTLWLFLYDTLHLQLLSLRTLRFQSIQSALLSPLPLKSNTMDRKRTLILFIEWVRVSMWTYTGWTFAGKRHGYVQFKRAPRLKENNVVRYKGRK